MPFKSIDTIVDENKTVNYPTEFLNSRDISGMPPHNLRLKIGSLILVLHPEMYLGLTFDAPAPVHSIARRNKFPDARFECDAIPPYTSKYPAKLREFLTSDFRFSFTTLKCNRSALSAHQDFEVKPLARSAELSGKVTEISRNEYQIKIARLNILQEPSFCFPRHLSYTRAFGDGPRPFQPWSSEEDDT
ncbi:hypothetical protein TNCV_4599161 [Trichonephila clavipes]|nr:hypothetical protein TNCV_4599161 [Trichonephila clavipes]